MVVALIYRNLFTVEIVFLNESWPRSITVPDGSLLRLWSGADHTWNSSSDAAQNRFHLLLARDVCTANRQIYFRSAPYLVDIVLKVNK